MQPPTVTRGQRRSRQLCQCARCAAAPAHPPAMRLPPKDDTVPAPRECSRRPSPKDNAVPANSDNAPAAPPLLRTLWQCACCACRPRTMPFPPTPAMRPPLLRTLRQCARCACRPRTTPFPLTLLMRPLRRRSCAFPPMRLLHKDDTAPAPRECSRRPSREDNAVPANSDNAPVAQGQRHPRALFDNATAAFPLEDNAVPAPSVNSMWREAMLMRNHIDCAKKPQVFWNHFVCFVAQAPFAQTLQ